MSESVQSPEPDGAAAPAAPVEVESVEVEQGGVDPIDGGVADSGDPGAGADVVESAQAEPAEVGSAAAAAGADAADAGASAGSGDEVAAPEQRGESRRATRVKQLEREGEIAADFLETLLDIADLDGDLDVDVEGDRAIVAIVDSEEGRVPRRLVGTDGKVLDALQELTRLAVQAETGERSRLMLDVAGHRAARRTALVNLAKVAIATVKESGRRYELEPMSAFERKVVHDEVAAAGLVSESEGVEPNRYVVIQPE